MEDKIEILPVSLLDQYQDLVCNLKKLASSLRLEIGWHYLLDLTWIISQLDISKNLQITDAGAGTGILQWYLAEQGVTVLSVDRESRANLPLRFRFRYSVRGKNKEDLEPNYKTILYQAGDQGLLRSLAGTAREILDVKPGSQNSGKVMIYNRDLVDLVDVPSCSQDAVVAVSSLEHNSPRALQEVIKELMRVIKPGGVLLATLGAARDEDWFHEPSKGWCYSDVTLKRIFNLSQAVSTNYEQFDELFSALHNCGELRDNLASFYSNSGDNGMPWGIWNPEYQPVGICKVKRNS
ncbi:MAG: class I SAM-dependent methyltransferase [Anaerolineales bacterium]|nr:class I SAM-dependent methyltransferase [Anaerolineales bacterium]